MKDCPPDAIHRSVNGEVFIDDSCIGCGNCQHNCPYGVIQIAFQRECRPRSVWQVIFGTGKSLNVVDDANKEATKKAVKCDMCKGIVGGAACVRACPTGAALRVSPEIFMGYVE